MKSKILFDGYLMNKATVLLKEFDYDISRNPRYTLQILP